MQEFAREVLHRLRQALYQLREEPAMDTSFVAYVFALLDRIEHGSGVRTRLSLGPWLAAAQHDGRDRARADQRSRRA